MNKNPSILVVAVLGLAAGACAASPNDKVITGTTIVGGHDSGRNTQVVAVPETATPYALTGTAAPKQVAEIRVGNRIVAQRPVSP